MNRNADLGPGGLRGSANAQQAREMLARGIKPKNLRWQSIPFQVQAGESIQLLPYDELRIGLILNASTAGGFGTLVSFMLEQGPLNPTPFDAGTLPRTFQVSPYIPLNFQVVPRNPVTVLGYNGTANAAVYGTVIYATLDNSGGASQ